MINYPVEWSTRLGADPFAAAYLCLVQAMQ